ncbi:restriction endonuclease subunit S [Fructilactobacillus cliffordii]|uniref:Restriction endonuclease subunit S n=1 Tax=Fructilactobacillus cliffordii TaxID=2940299 RepID=A0A9Q9E3M9_9LACO|nr:restriction endonuclease subunit S [Fructilactobacillus cliffordii]USS89962.1 restriction endonuclease subunit S [Fructilactobacillus cliffordii]
MPVTKNKRTLGKIPYYGANGIQDYVNGFTHQGKLILIAEDGANDLNDYPIKVISGKAWINNHVHVLSGKENISNYIFISNSLKKINIKPYLTGSGRMKLNGNELKKINIYTPLIKEQAEIGSLFEKTDMLITVNQHKLEQLKLLKKAQLQQLFPQKDEINPQIRFTYFHDDWKQQKLGELVQVKGGGTPSSSIKSYWNGNIDWFTPTEVNNNGYLKHSKRKITEEGLKHSSANLLPKNTILMSSRAGIGKMAILSNKATTNQGFQSLIPKNNNNPYFLYSMQNIISKEANKLSSGSTFTEISGKEVSKISIFIPISSGEQEKIGNILNEIDELIKLYENKIKNIEKLKKVLLQNMFI